MKYCINCIYSNNGNKNAECFLGSVYEYNIVTGKKILNINREKCRDKRNSHSRCGPSGKNFIHIKDKNSLEYGKMFPWWNMRKKIRACFIWFKQIFKKQIS